MPILRKTCLKPTYTLRKQLFIAFGTTSAIAIGVVMLIACLSAKNSGDSVKEEARESLSVQVEDNLAASSRYVAETITQKFDNLGGAVSLMTEATRDRFVGYPDDPDYAGDLSVPFRDAVSGKNVYPLDSKPIPLDWEIEVNINEENEHEHLQDRRKWYPDDAKISTARAAYGMQGACNPAAEPNENAYYPGCSSANNDITTGGVVKPTSTNRLIHDKGSDLDFILKPLYESHQDVKLFGVYFANEGAGSSISYPAVENDHKLTYESIGCEWMNEINPFTQEPFSSKVNITQCHKEGETVKGRDYNPLERGWCRDQALNPGTTQSVGPYLDASSEHLWLLTFGRAVFDRSTRAFIGCTLADVSIDQVVDIIHSAKIGETSNVALIRWDDEGTVVASTKWNSDEESKTRKITDLDLGMGIDEDMYGDMLTDFEGTWTLEEVRNFYKNTIYSHEGKLISMFPVPVPPLEYSEVYHPEYMAIMSIDESEVYDEVDEMDSTVDDDVDALIRNTIITGVVGLAVVLVVLWIDSRILTKPLVWMEQVAGQISKNAGGDLGTGINQDDQAGMAKCTPRTEITELVSEFKRMICGLNDKGAAKIARATVKETQNQFTFKEEFRELYRGGTPRRKYHGKIVPEDSPAADVSNKEKLDEGGDCTKKRCLLRSPLFLWITLTIVTPLLLTMIIVCTLVTTNIKDVVPGWLEDVETASTDLERDAVVTASLLRSSFSKEVMARPISDLHLFSRVAGWLLFSGIDRASSFTDMTTGTEECKTFSSGGSCPYLEDMDQTPCDCDWNDVHEVECDAYQEDTRYLQKRFYSGQSQDADPITGDRMSCPSFHNNSLSKSPKTTDWWDDIEKMPGSSKGGNAIGYATTYDRVRVSSALAVVEMPIFNYHRNTENYFGTYVGFENDGMFVGWTGCSYSNAEDAHWQSTEANRAFEIREELCPEGKYGYDPRCRDWYDTGKTKAIHRQFSDIHITPPYVFASTGVTASSATFGLVDPITDGHVAQTLVDFSPQAIMDALRAENTIIGQGEGGFPIVITPEVDNLGGDTVVGPGFTLTGDGSPIADTVLPHDIGSSRNREMFNESVISRMKAGETGVSTFTRATDDGEEEEIYISYAPVSVGTLHPTYSRDFKSGVEVSSALVYSLGIAIPEKDLSLPFTNIENDVSHDIDVSTATLTALIVAASLVVGAVTYFMAASIANPILILLNVVKNINRKRIEQDMPVIKGGSKEITEVYDSFHSLYTVVRFSNSAFFSGDLQKAYDVLHEALNLFVRLSNERARGIACNNLGNTVASMYEEMKSRGRPDLYQGIHQESAYPHAKQHFNDAIDMGQRAVHEADQLKDFENKALLEKQLANRLFNRGMFLLRTHKDSCAEDGAEDFGYNDILKAKALDDTSRRYWTDNEVMRDHITSEFDCLLGRARGLISLLEDNALTDMWGIPGLIEMASRLLDSAWDDAQSPLFEDVSRVARKQQLEGLKVQYAMCTGDAASAAETGMRMLVEDDFVVEEEYKRSLFSAIAYLKSSSKLQDRVALKELCRTCVVNGIDVPPVGSKDVVFCLDYSYSMHGERIERASKNLLFIYDKHCKVEDNVGFVRFNSEVDTKLRFTLDNKGENCVVQRSILKRAVNASNGTRLFHALDHVTQMVENETENPDNVWIIALTDGMSADTHYSVMNRMQAIRRDQGIMINLIIVGFNVPTQCKEICQDLCGNVSQKSIYIDATGGLEEMDRAFLQVASVIGGGTTMEML